MLDEHRAAFEADGEAYDARRDAAGAAQECAPVSFRSDLGEICCEDGASLRFAAEAERSHRQNLLIVSSDYRAPFGSFSGTLPGVRGGGPGALAHGLGVVEHHRARW